MGNGEEINHFIKPCVFHIFGVFSYSVIIRTFLFLNFCFFCFFLSFSLSCREADGSRKTLCSNDNQASFAFGELPLQIPVLISYSQFFLLYKPLYMRALKETTPTSFSPTRRFSSPHFSFGANTSSWNKSVKVVTKYLRSWACS
jgi:hypothetical protein